MGMRENSFDNFAVFSTKVTHPRERCVYIAHDEECSRIAVNKFLPRFKSSIVLPVMCGFGLAGHPLENPENLIKSSKI